MWDQQGLVTHWMGRGRKEGGTDSEGLGQAPEEPLGSSILEVSGNQH